MWLADTVDGLSEAAPGICGICPGCGGSVIPKCGELISWHWAHVAGEDCDTWHEPMTAWHRNWQSAAPSWRREVPIGRHRADVVTVDGRIYEFQHSSLDPDELTEREDFYRGDLVWLWDAREAYDEDRLHLERDLGDRREVKFHWPKSRRSIGLCARAVFLDLGPYVLGTQRHNDTMSWGLGRLWEPDVVKARLATEGPAARRFSTCADGSARARLTPPADADLSIIQPRPCAICSGSTMQRNRHGQPQCDDCATYAAREDMPECLACGFPLLPEDVAVGGCHPTCLPERS